MRTLDRNTIIDRNTVDHENLVKKKNSSRLMRAPSGQNSIKLFLFINKIFYRVQNIFVCVSKLPLFLLLFVCFFVFKYFG